MKKMKIDNREKTDLVTWIWLIIEITLLLGVIFTNLGIGPYLLLAFLFWLIWAMQDEAKHNY